MLAPMSATAPERTLYQFPISHYCEKTRWHLDAKGLSYSVHNLLPGLHRRVTQRVAGITTVPLLMDRGTPIGDSSQIALHLERTYPDTPSLLPASGPERESILELEEFFDDAAGIHVRRWLYGQLLEGSVLASIMFPPGPGRLLGRVMLPLIKSSLRKLYAIRPDTVEESRKRLLAGLDRLERQIDGDPSRYLVGNSLSLADITAASLYGPLVAPANSPWKERPGVAYPSAATELRAQVRARPGGQWVLRRYEQDRRTAKAS
jgi:glutathione S-transferase